MITLPHHTMDAAIIVSPYARLRDVVHREAAQYLWFVDTDELMRDAERMAAHPLWNFAPVALAPAISIPVLVLHGDRDTRFPIAEGREVFAAIHASPRKEFLEAKGAGHNDVLSEGNPWSARTWSAFDQFLDSLKTEPGTVRR